MKKDLALSGCRPSLFYIIDCTREKGDARKQEKKHMQYGRKFLIEIAPVSQSSVAKKQHSRRFNLCEANQKGSHFFQTH